MAGPTTMPNEIMPAANADGFAALVGRPGLGDDGNAQSQHHRCANGLYKTESDQPVDCWRQTTQYRSNDEQDDAGSKDDLLADQIGQSPHADHEHGQSQKISQDHPLQGREIGAQFFHHRGQRNIDDTAVDTAQEKRQADGDQDAPFVCVRWVPAILWFYGIVYAPACVQAVALSALCCDGVHRCRRRLLFDASFHARRRVW